MSKTEQTSKETKLPPIAPRYWLIWLFIGALRLSTYLPFRVQLFLGRIMGRFSRLFASRRRRITDINLALCYPELSPDERHEIAVKHFEALGIGAFEIALCWWAPAERLRSIVSITGLHHLEAALEKGKGAILLSAHFTTLEIGARLITFFTPVQAMYKPNRNPMLEWIILNRRRVHLDKVIPQDSVRTLMRSLRDNKVVWYAPDQGFTGKHSEMVPFFGVPAPTNTATSRIAKSSGAPVLPYMVERLPGAQGYALTIHPPLESFPSGDQAEDAARINAMIEKEARRIPDQYLWCHNRFKTKAHRKKNRRKKNAGKKVEKKTAT
ncbi:MAG: LpxL/LpxP family Kdo(2)-lipid IV(A) lauroyl/palmitoleoyl acyltransferase [Gammaproteobacteria bacterium]|nr:LpxL/LpxP family Kdo(2)-lipid IV(A) lauroyl/palmitoleoyl acyltransferase [Gammaproteobacteria bacterium]